MKLSLWKWICSKHNSCCLFSRQLEKFNKMVNQARAVFYEDGSWRRDRCCMKNIGNGVSLLTTTNNDNYILLHFSHYYLFPITSFSIHSRSHYRQMYPVCSSILHRVIKRKQLWWGRNFGMKTHHSRWWVESGEEKELCKLNESNKWKNIVGVGEKSILKEWEVFPKENQRELA